MFNAKPIVFTLLTNDAGLTALVPKTRIFHGTAIFKKEPIFPFIVYDQLDNHESLHADDEEVETEVTFRFKIYNRDSTSTIANNLERVLKSIQFGRNYTQDQEEALETGEIIKYEVMSYTATFTADLIADINLTWGTEFAWGG
jgi:hypothetical protein